MFNGKYFVADFESTVYAGQTFTEVWSASITPVGNTDPDMVIIFHSIDEFMRSFKKLGFYNKGRIRIYFHNLKFDGSFILVWLLTHKNTAITRSDAAQYFTQDRNMFNGEFKYMVSAKGQFYAITYKVGNTLIEFIDSLKMIPLSVEEVGKSFDTIHRKLEMEYTGLRWAGCPIKKEEEDYIKNDVLVMSEALDVYINDEGNKKSTIGSNCVHEFKQIVGMDWFHLKFPKLTDFVLPTGEVEDDYIRKSYKGGYCICYRKGIKRNGVTLDINSEYPFVMGKYKIPIGKGKYYDSNKEPEVRDNTYFFVRIRCNFKIKKNKIPTIQIKNNPIYRGNEWLETSYIKDHGRYIDKYRIGDQVYETRQELTLCETDYLLLKDHYDLYDFEVLDYVIYDAEKGLFDDYMSKYFDIKTTSTGGKRLIAKLFLNNLYGKLGTSPDSSFKVAKLVDGVLKWEIVDEKKKGVYHVASASAITGWARWYTITHAQANYKYFCYADTDSLHLNCSLDQIKDIELDEVEIGKWDCEMEWTVAKFLRQKTYVEINEPEHNVNVTACGMGKIAKKNVMYALDKEAGNGLNNESELEMKRLDLDFIERGMSLDDFDIGLVVNGNLKLKQIKGGAILFEDVFEIN